MSTLRIHPAKEVMHIIRREAEKRSTTESGLIAALVRTVANHDLWEAVFDGLRVDAGATRINRDGWTPERIALFQELAEKGWTTGQIAGRLKISRAAVSGRGRRMGIKFGKGREK